MIELKGVSKVYKSQTNQSVQALKCVNFELGNTGMVFVLGKSGSGKSTLLNLLGGLDAPTQGEIVVDGVSMKNFKQADYDSYRNGYVGFIFQEYNLLKDFNVRDNVALALQLRGEKNTEKQVVHALEQVELSAKYLRRRVGELSGGEKQRVAIARCIIKDSKVILADEPTGNLDSATGESIWNILKTLSKTKLVVVVSHDRESAEKYADRIIEIADGAIVSDSGVKQIYPKNTTLYKPQKKRLAFITCLKMGVDSIRYRKGKTACVILLCIFSLLALLITQMCLCFSPTKTIAKYVKEEEIPFVVVMQPQQEYGDDDPKKIMSDALAYLSQHTDYIVDRFVDNKQQVLEFGFKFVGEAQELNSTSYYVTSDTLEDHIKKGFARVLIDGVKVEVVPELHSVDFLIGKQVDLGLFYCEGDNVPILAGVVDLDALNGLVKQYAPMYFTTNDFEYGENNLEYIPYAPLYVKTLSVHNLNAILSNLTNKFGYKIVKAGKIYNNSSNSSSTKDVVEVVAYTQDTMRTFALVTGVLCIVMLTILVLLVINLVAFSIADRKRQIGILSALGASNADIAKIFIFEVLVIAAICFVITVLLAFGVATIVNLVFSNQYIQKPSYLRVDMITVAVVAVASFGLLTLSAWVPLRKIAKLNPIDAIRN